MGGRIRPVHQTERLDHFLEIVEDEPWLNTRRLRSTIDVQDRPQVSRHIDDDRHIAALPSQARARAVWQNRGPILATRAHRLHHVVGDPRGHHTNRRLPVIGRVGGIEGP